MKDTNKKHVELPNARHAEQIAIMKRAIEDGVCPFCFENLENYHPEPIEFITDEWVVSWNAFPYEFTKICILVIARKHIESSKEISPKGWAEIGEIIKRLEEELGMDYGTMVMRFGDASKTGASIRHLHFHLVQSDPNHPEYDPNVGVMVRIG